MIANLIRNLTSGRKTSNRRAFRPMLDGLEARVALNGGWVAAPSFSPSTTTPNVAAAAQYTVVQASSLTMGYTMQVA